LTNVQVDLTVTDTQNGTVKTYRNPQNTSFQPIQDTSAFSTCSSSASAYAGTWTGSWTNQTFGSSGSAMLVDTVNTSAQTFQATLTFGGNVFGAGTPPPQDFSGSYAGSSFSQVSSLFGNVTITFTSPGVFTGNATSVPNPNIARIDFTGTASSQTITLNYTITFTPAAGGGTAVGVMTLNHVS
jgi:hypothetical protein